MGGSGRTGRTKIQPAVLFFLSNQEDLWNMIFVEEDLLEKGGETGIVENWREDRVYREVRIPWYHIRLRQTLTSNERNCAQIL